MGSICTIFSSVSRWSFLDEGYSIKDTGEHILLVRYGIFDDDMTGTQDLEIYMRKFIVDNLLERKYSVCKNSILRRELVILDENKNVIIPFSKDFIY